MKTRTYLFTASHNHCARLNFDRERISVRQDYAGGYFARHPELGCSKTKATPEGAIFDMVTSHGCHVTDIRPAALIRTMPGYYAACCAVKALDTAHEAMMEADNDPLTDYMGAGDVVADSNVRRLNRIAYRYGFSCADEAYDTLSRFT